MSSSPRSNATRTAIFALGVGAAIIIVSLLLLAFGVDVLKIGDTFVTGLFPPIAVTSQGAQIRELYTVIFLIAVAIFLVVEGLIIWTVIRYRRKPGDDSLPPQTHGNNIAEFVWTVVPTLIVIFMFIVSWQTLNAVDTNAADANTTKIRAVAAQFQWQFDYLDQNDQVLYTEYIPLVSGGGGMMVPAGRTVQLSLVSKDVIHAFYVPQFLFKRDVVPGRTNQFDFTVDAADAGQTFRGQCAELCGIGHSIMLFEVKALSPQDFDSWLAGKAAQNPPAASPGASGAPAPSGSAPAPSGSAAPAPSGSGGPAPSAAAGTTLTLTASNIQYTEKTLTAPANAPFQIDFDNQDPGVPHNVTIHKDSPTGEQVFAGDIFPGVAKKTYDIPALPAGTYSYVCAVHPTTMIGTLTVQ
ncbi:MAG TPA: cytochrome c oxidase subunit II [Candidatus Limnocylindrales bacterium]|jgi:cytochrome c oxidase subunit 2|nr:cytochrome c oxidase subunit II [Candidatus Limnocylindrales bacterium]